MGQRRRHEQGDRRRVTRAPTGDDAVDTAGPATRLIGAGRRPEWTGGVVNPPVVHASTCTFDTLATFDER
ncbi:MAG: hypothetical protein AAF205_13500, partial [Pseudomonadota bacterium]